MWSLILYILFGLGNSSQSQTPLSHEDESQMIKPYGASDGGGGDVVNPRPPKI
jgi:hypothetical protein